MFVVSVVTVEALRHSRDEADELLRSQVKQRNACDGRATRGDAELSPRASSPYNPADGSGGTARDGHAPATLSDEETDRGVDASIGRGARCARRRIVRAPLRTGRTLDAIASRTIAMRRPTWRRMCSSKRIVISTPSQGHVDVFDVALHSIVRNESPNRLKQLHTDMEGEEVLADVAALDALPDALAEARDLAARLKEFLTANLDRRSRPCSRSTLR